MTPEQTLQQHIETGEPLAREEVRDIVAAGLAPDEAFSSVGGDLYKYTSSGEDTYCDGCGLDFGHRSAGFVCDTCGKLLCNLCADAEMRGSDVCSECRDDDCDGGCFFCPLNEGCEKIGGQTNLED